CFDRLVDRSSVITLTSLGAATDLAAQAARCALSLRPSIDAPIAVVSGRGVMSTNAPMGELIDRAAAMLERADSRVIHIDDATFRLLDTRFDVSEESGGLMLRGERDSADVTPQSSSESPRRAWAARWSSSCSRRRSPSVWRNRQRGSSS